MSSRAETEAANTMGICAFCGVRVGRAAQNQLPTGVVLQWRIFSVTTGSPYCMDKVGAKYLIDAKGLPQTHQLSLPNDDSREEVERWLES